MIKRWIFDNRNLGCQGYRYVNSNNPMNNPVPVGQEFTGDTLYSCRAYHEGNIIPGKYHMGRKECHVAFGNGEHSKGTDVEVLTNPNGANFQWVSSGSLPSNAVRGGRTNERETLYVIRCQIESGGQTTWMPGKFQPSTGPYTSYAGKEIRCTGAFEYLTCVNNI
jgi:hypothetical protein